MHKGESLYFKDMHCHDYSIAFHTTIEKVSYILFQPTFEKSYKFEPSVYNTYF